MQSVFKQTKKFPGGWVLGACFTLLTFSSGLGFYGLAVYLQAFSRELGWSVSSISLATTFFFLVGGISGIPIAKFIAKHDVRIMIIGGATVAALALFSMRFVEQRCHPLINLLTRSPMHSPVAPETIA